MATQAETLCAELGLDFARGFSQQFHCARSETCPQIDGFKAHPFGTRTVQTGATLPVARFDAPTETGEISVIFLGMGVDADGFYVDDARLPRALGTARSIEDLTTYVAGCGGRYCAFVRHGAAARFLLDPSGSMGAVANIRARTIAATLYLAIDRPLEPSDYPMGVEGRRYAFGYTADRDVISLRPNHYLDLETFEQIRHWPLDTDRFEVITLDELDRGIDQVIERHCQIMRALARQNAPSILPLSGGEDSRLLLAMAHAGNLRFDHYFTHITTDITKGDAQTGAQLAETLGLPITIYDIVGQEHAPLPQPETIRRLQEAALASGSPAHRREDFAPRRRPRAYQQKARILHATLSLPEGGFVMRGQITDLSKAVLWRPAGMKAFAEKSGGLINPATGVRLMMVDKDVAETDPWFLSQYEAWQNTLPAGSHRCEIDLMGLELLRSYSWGNAFYSFVNNFYISPGCDRQVIRLLASAPPLMRYEFHYNDRVLERAAPELIKFPYTRANDNRMRHRRPAFLETLERYGLSASRQTANEP